MVSIAVLSLLNSRPRWFPLRVSSVRSEYRRFGPFSQTLLEREFGAATYQGSEIALKMQEAEHANSSGKTQPGLQAQWPARSNSHNGRAATAASHRYKSENPGAFVQPRKLKSPATAFACHLVEDFLDFNTRKGLRIRTTPASAKRGR